MMAIPVAGMFVDKRGDLGETKSGKDVFRYPVFPVANPYKGKLVILTNELTASTSEILAAGLQECGRATVVGGRTMGAVLPSLIIKLESGGIIQYPMGDFKTPKGTLLEGRGVSPDVSVSFDEKTLKAGNDPILVRALETIVKEGNEK
jgi:carboxyl-terminal processing protease